MRPGDQSQKSVSASIDIIQFTYQAIGTTVSIDAKLRTHVATLEQRHEPVQVAACSTAHKGAASIHEVVLVFIWEVFHAGRRAAEETRRAEPCSELKRSLACISVKGSEKFRHTQVPQSPPQTWLNRPLRHSPLDISLFGSDEAGDAAGGRKCQ